LLIGWKFAQSIWPPCGSATPSVSPHAQPPFSNYSFLVRIICLRGWPASPCTGQWPLTSQSYGSFLIQKSFDGMIFHCFSAERVVRFLGLKKLRLINFAFTQHLKNTPSWYFCDFLNLDAWDRFNENSNLGRKVFSQFFSWC
jgi:hypothetical protein